MTREVRAKSEIPSTVGPNMGSPKPKPHGASYGKCKIEITIDNTYLIMTPRIRYRHDLALWRDAMLSDSTVALKFACLRSADPLINIKLKRGLLNPDVII